MNESWTQIILAIIGFGGTALGVWKVIAAQSDKREERIMNLYAAKNGQMEKLSNEVIKITREVMKVVQDSNTQTNLLREKLTEAVRQNTAATNNLEKMIQTATMTNKEALAVVKEIKE